MAAGSPTPDRRPSPATDDGERACTASTACSWAWTSARATTTRSALAPDGQAAARRAAAQHRSPAAGAVQQARPSRTGAGRWSTSPPRSARCPSRSPAPAGTRSPTCPVWRCAASLTCTPGRRRPMPATPTSSPTPPAPCRTRCAASTPATKPSPSWRSWSASTTTSPARPPGSATASAACSPRSTQPWNASSGPQVAAPRGAGAAVALRRPGRRCARPAAANSPRSPPSTHPAWVTRLVEQILAALAEQTVIVPGTAAAETVLPRLADCCATPFANDAQVADQVEGILDAHPLAEVLTSMPGIGVRTAARILLEVGDATAFPTSGHLAAYAGLAPVTRRSGTSIRGEHPPRGGNKQPQTRVLPGRVRLPRRPDQPRLLRPQTSRGQKHNAALICLARRRFDVLYAMLRTKTPTRPPSTTTPRTRRRPPPDHGSANITTRPAATS